MSEGEWTDDRLQAESNRLEALFLAKRKEAQEADLSDDGEIDDWIAKRYPELSREIFELMARMYAAAQSARIIERLSGLAPWRDDEPAP
jgi:hypothetical protein